MNESHPNLPPKAASRLLSWFAGRADLEDIQGDMDEMYSSIYKEKGRFNAQTYYWKQVISLLFSYALRRRRAHQSLPEYYSPNQLAMIRNYFKIAFRNFSKHKLFTSLNIFGLALGMSVCLLALSFIVAIYGSDNDHAYGDRIYQLNTTIEDETDTKSYASTFMAVGDHLQEKYPFVEEVVKIKSGFNPEFKHQGNLMNFSGYYAGAAFFDVFSFDMISGDPHSALAEPFSIVLTQSVAEILFKDDNAIGKTLESDYGTFKVTGVIADLKQTHFYFKVLTSHATYDQLPVAKNQKTDWVNYRNNYVYTLLKPGTDQYQLNEALTQISTVAAEFNPTKKVALESINLTEVVPRWNISNALGIGWDQFSMLFFLSIGLLVLLPAVFNYTNLSIARALKRAKEIGIRKVVGADKSQIKAQFIVETVLLSLLALLGSLFIYVPIKEEFLSMVIAAEVLDTSIGVVQVLVFVGFAIVVGILAGLFPARYFSRLNPIQTMKGKIINGKSDVSGFKKGLFVFQFFLSLVFIIGVAAITRQYSYVLNHNHGFESNNVLAVPFESMNKQVIFNEFKNHPDVKGITSASNLPGVYLPTEFRFTPNDLDTLASGQVFIGEDFIPNMKMKLVWGESESLQQSTKNEEFVLVNQAFMRSVDVFNEKGDSLTFTTADGTHCRIAGIMADFNFEPLNRLISPLVFRYSLEASNYALLTVNSTDIKKTVNELDAIWSNVDQKEHFEATFLDDEIEKAYHFLTVQIKFFGFLSTMAIIISCLGLLGMVSYTTENRTKEIAVRKIMGASNQSLYYLLTKDFVKLILIAALIAVPFSYVFYDRLFLYVLIRYGSGLGVWEVLGSIVFLFLIGFVSIYWQTSKVAKANPAGNLRYE